MSALLSKSVETRGIGGIEPVHALRQVRGGRLHCQMEVIVHDDECMQAPSVQHRRLEQAVLKGFRRPCLSKNRRPVITPVDRVVDCVRKLQTEGARHPLFNATFPAFVSDVGLFQPTF